MKQLRVTVRVAADRAPAFFDLLANAPAISEARLLDWNLSPEGAGTVLYAIDGDPESFATGATDTPGIESVELSGTDGSWTYALVVIRPLETPVFAAIHRATTRAGLVVRTPIVYRDGTMQAHVVGESASLQSALDEAPDAVTVQVDEIGRLEGSVDTPGSALSDRQREAVAVAMELGYYDHPRGATHEDVAAELGCAPSTASDHLQKAEAKLVFATVGAFE
jgi:predicted DNA binding protein